MSTRASSTGKATWLVLACLASCSRRVATSGASSGPPPQSDVEASRQSTPWALDGAPSARRLGHTPVPVRLGDRDVAPYYARLALPSPGHPRGTLAVTTPRATASQAADGKALDPVFIEVDLATGDAVRSFPWEGGALVDGASGPIAVTDPDMTVVWYDRTFTEVTRRTFHRPNPGARKCGMEAIGDRVVIGECQPDSAPFWIVDAQKGATLRECDGVVDERWSTIRPWKEKVLIANLSPRESQNEMQYTCAFRADGTGGVERRSLDPGTSVFAWEGTAYARTGFPRTPYSPLPEGIYVLDDALSPVGRPTQNPRPPEELEAEGGADLPLRSARLISGTLVQRAATNRRSVPPFLWLEDPHAVEP